jgi:hypothetical protein
MTDQTNQEFLHEMLRAIAIETVAFGWYGRNLNLTVDDTLINCMQTIDDSLGHMAATLARERP